MSSNCKPKGFRSDIHRLLLAAEAGQKADVKAYSSGHLGPRSLNQTQPKREKMSSFWRTSQSHDETPNPLTLQQAKALISVKKKEIKESSMPSAEPDVSGSRQVQAADHSPHTERREELSLPKIVDCSSNSLPVQLLDSSQKTSSSDPKRKHTFCVSSSDQEGLNSKGQLQTKQHFGRQVLANHDLWAGINVVEMHERKLQKELKKLSAQSWPSRDRLVVFSDVFDDVCEGSPVFGRILREIKTDYDLYVNHLMASQSPLPETSENASFILGSGKVREMKLEDAEKEVCRLEEEARRALEENKRVRNELQNVPAIKGPEDCYMKNISLSELPDTAVGCSDSIQIKRLQVLNTWREIQQLEEELEEKLVSTSTTTATERRIKDLKSEIMRLIASNDRLKTTNKDLEKKINMVLDREKASKAIRRELPQPRPGYQASEPDGCSSSLVGFQLDLGIPAMTQCCNQLDVCYDTCGTSKYDCDSKFRSCLHGICSDLNKSLGFVNRVQACETMADTLFNTVWTLGCRSYMNSQRAACFCEGEERDEL
ncbi:group XIIB secretory phospholipase A2-like protein isoform X2 [Sparus aurata]|uniref:group XIIB secretory phospholipase A2-like protein isoform X2 n=1 Tax=Sparus aurata TaxID=8175 RepID=UPI0011C174E9|nr:uncharacterized protein C6orf118-like isoform X2 [Sparus aurata]